MGKFGPPYIDKVKAKKYLQGFFKAMGFKKDLEVHKSTAFFLGIIGDCCAVEPLIAQLNHEKKNVRQAAAEAPVNLFQTNRINQEIKHTILVDRPTVMRVQVDKRESHGSCLHDDHHEDKGIGVGFPV